MKAIYTTIKTTKHPNADRLLLGEAAGYQVIVGKDTVDGSTGILIPEGSCLSTKFCLEHNLLRKLPDGSPGPGYLEPNGRVKALKLRGEYSTGIWISATLPYAIGDEFNEWDGELFIKKYLTPATRLELKKQGSKKVRVQPIPKHYDTEQLRNNAFRLANRPGILVWTEKVHGTSGRTGNVPRTGWLWRLVPRRWRYHVVSGTRNCIVATEGSGNAEKDKLFRVAVHEYFAERLQRDEVVYYEIVGYESRLGKSIMPSHKDDKKTYFYDYGCTALGRGLGDLFRVYVYRIVQNGRDLTWRQIQYRMIEIGKYGAVETVPLLERTTSDTSVDDILERARGWANSNSEINYQVHREGVCVRHEHGDQVGNALKYKGNKFCVLEGIRANDPDFIDPEDVA